MQMQHEGEALHYKIPQFRRQNHPEKSFTQGASSPQVIIHVLVYSQAEPATKCGLLTAPGAPVPFAM
jgi:hypothetical protein